MYQMSINQLKHQTSDMIRRVREGETIAITYHEQIIAHIVPREAHTAQVEPVATTDSQPVQTSVTLAELKQLVAETGSRHQAPDDQTRQAIRNLKQLTAELEARPALPTDARTIMDQERR